MASVMAELQKKRAAEEDCRGSLQVQQAPAHGVGGGGGGVGEKRKLSPWEEEEGEELHNFEEQSEVILPEHIPQAFSHFSYKYSDGMMLVYSWSATCRASTTIAPGFTEGKHTQQSLSSQNL
jgi:hypothetical protein